MRRELAQRQNSRAREYIVVPLELEAWRFHVDRGIARFWLGKLKRPTTSVAAFVSIPVSRLVMVIVTPANTALVAFAT